MCTPLKNTSESVYILPAVHTFVLNIIYPNIKEKYVCYKLIQHMNNEY